MKRWRANWRHLRAWWGDPGGVLSVKRRPFTLFHLESAILEEVTADPEAIPAILRDLDDSRRRSRIRRVK